MVSSAFLTIVEGVVCIQDRLVRHGPQLEGRIGREGEGAHEVGFLGLIREAADGVKEPQIFLPLPQQHDIGSSAELAVLPGQGQGTLGRHGGGDAVPIAVLVRQRHYLQRVDSVTVITHIGG